MLTKYLVKCSKNASKTDLFDVVVIKWNNLGYIVILIRCIVGTVVSIHPCINNESKTEMISNERLTYSLLLRFMKVGMNNRKSDSLTDYK